MLMWVKKLSGRPHSTLLFGMISLAIVVFGSSCGKKQEAPLPKPPASPPPMPTPVAEEIKEKPVYVYGGDKYRDPFQTAGASTNYQAEAVFDPQRSVVRGIIYSSRFKSAVLN